MCDPGHWDLNGAALHLEFDRQLTLLVGGPDPDDLTKDSEALLGRASENGRPQAVYSGRTRY